MVANTLKQEEYEKIVKDFFAKSKFSNAVKEKFTELFIKYSRYYEVQIFSLNTIKESYEYSKNILEDLEKTDFKDKVKKDLYDTLMKNSYLMDVGNVALESQKSLAKEHNDALDKINKTTSEKARNTLKTKTTRLRKESAALKDLAEELAEVTKKTYKEATKARKTINDRIEKLEKKANKRR